MHSKRKTYAGFVCHEKQKLRNHPNGGTYFIKTSKLHGCQVLEQLVDIFEKNMTKEKIFLQLFNFSFLQLQMIK
jgi:hypothetical protein